MDKRTIERYDGYTIYITVNGRNQIHIIASVSDDQADAKEKSRQIYSRISDILKERHAEIVHERLFGSRELYKSVSDIRENILIDANVQPFTWVEGHPWWGRGFAGLQIRAVTIDAQVEKIWTIYDDSKSCGRAWQINGTKYIILHNINGRIQEPGADNSREAQTARMFDNIQSCLEREGADFKNVVRTWIYLADILDWYDAFNKVRTAKFKELGLFTNDVEHKVAENIYMPASTGIEGKNPMDAAGVCDVFAIVRDPQDDLIIEVAHGLKQKSAFRYGSAFSRAMSIRERLNTHVLVSGTASIDDTGATVYIGDTRAQIQKTIDVVDALVAAEGAGLEDICDATVFLKKPQDIELYKKIAAEKGLEDMPAVFVVADVCRANLLFELDASVSLTNGKL
ncbi:hypothetical protein JW935_15580 [candidate division KSB1 bacterium]|nr:hypothetical protein [candidate division KSB1 bacterium]